MAGTGEVPRSANSRNLFKPSTPLDFVRNIKMKRACMMLLARTQTISEVAYAVGFSNPKYFTKCFKEEFGVTPTEYQQSHIKA